MIKGAQKQMIVIRTADSRYFDEAYFVLRTEIKAHRGCKDDMLCEANRILEQSGIESVQKKKKTKPRSLLLFLLGILCGGGIAVLICILAL